eukprot:TRINITY_DN27046_c0_g1_i1.p1 TRINITY_DN27046_c0_g1~~TRINITY_DN27046_c0_g1_i1.p1  ORF type:complete len:428 (-),score=41.72 TRINITY_DN27046_c0_g1_i1:122-1405(-)
MFKTCRSRLLRSHGGSLAAVLSAGVAYTHERRSVALEDSLGSESELRSRRVVTVRGDAEERGAALGVRFGAHVGDTITLRKALYSPAGQKVWRELALGASDAWRESAPLSWKEMQGVRRGALSGSASVGEAELCMLGADYEMQMRSWLEPDLQAWRTESSEAPGGRCTAFAVTDAISSSPSPAHGYAVTTPKGVGQMVPMCGQNVDESVEGWFDGRYDVIVRHLGDPHGNPDALVYTHPGVPAYCGMNSVGLAVMNLFIDDGVQRDVGVPINAVLREVLKFRDVREAVQYLENLPRMAATTYMLVQGSTIVTVETTAASRTVTGWIQGQGDFCHSNHPILDQRMAGECGDPSSSSERRLNSIRDQVVSSRGCLDVQKARQILSSTPPVNSTFAPTIATVLMEPTHGRMHVLFRGEGQWLVVDFQDGA